MWLIISIAWNWITRQRGVEQLPRGQKVNNMQSSINIILWCWPINWTISASTMFHSILWARGSMKVNYALYSICSEPQNLDPYQLEHTSNSKVTTNYLSIRAKTYWAQENARSNAVNDPPMKGVGRSGSKAIHHPTGILTVFIPCLLRK